MTEEVVNYFLPPKTTNKKTLVLDLDETLVHSQFMKFSIPSDIIIKIEIEQEFYDIHVLVRPGVKEFLEKMEKFFEIVIFTASISRYAAPLLDILDEKGYCPHRLFREHCTLIKTTFVKNLQKLGRELKDIIIVDNSPLSYLLHPENGLPIITWFEDKNDRELYKIMPILEFLSEVNDVREYIPQIVFNDEISYIKAMELIDSHKSIQKEKSNVLKNNRKEKKNERKNKLRENKNLTNEYYLSYNNNRTKIEENAKKNFDVILDDSKQNNKRKAHERTKSDNTYEKTSNISQEKLLQLSKKNIIASVDRNGDSYNGLSSKTEKSIPSNAKSPPRKKKFIYKNNSTDKNIKSNYIIFNQNKEKNLIDNRGKNSGISKKAKTSTSVSINTSENTKNRIFSNLDENKNKKRAEFVFGNSPINPGKEIKLKNKENSPTRENVFIKKMYNNHEFNIITCEKSFPNENHLNRVNHNENKKSTKCPKVVMTNKNRNKVTLNTTTNTPKNENIIESFKSKNLLINHKKQNSVNNFNLFQKKQKEKIFGKPSGKIDKNSSKKTKKTNNFLKSAIQHKIQGLNTNNKIKGYKNDKNEKVNINDIDYNKTNRARHPIKYHIPNNINETDINFSNFQKDKDSLLNNRSEKGSAHNRAKFYPMNINPGNNSIKSKEHHKKTISYNFENSKLNSMRPKSLIKVQTNDRSNSSKNFVNEYKITRKIIKTIRLEINEILLKKGMSAKSREGKRMIKYNSEIIEKNNKSRSSPNKMINNRVFKFSRTNNK